MPPRPRVTSHDLRTRCSSRERTVTIAVVFVRWDLHPVRVPQTELATDCFGLHRQGRSELNCRWGVDTKTGDGINIVLFGGFVVGFAISHSKLFAPDQVIVLRGVGLHCTRWSLSGELFTARWVARPAGESELVNADYGQFSSC